MKKKVLFCATVDSHFKAFHLPYMKWFQDQQWEVHVAAGGNIELAYTDKKYDIQIKRSPFDFKNISAYKKLKKIIEENNYDIIHCHTPVGGVMARLAAKDARKVGTKVIYTAHGFHFYKGAPILNWCLYYPLEKILSNSTDCLITINEEDYELAIKCKFGAKRIEHVHGVGVNMDRFKPIDEIKKNAIREKFGYSESDFLMFYAAEINKNKNQKILIQALAEIKHIAPNARLLLAGRGPLMEEYKSLAKEIGVMEQVKFLGYREDIADLLPICDVAVASSLREGLPVNIMESMACALPVIAIDNRGHRELVEDGINGFLIQPNSVNSVSSAMLHLISSPKDRDEMGHASFEKVKNYSIPVIEKELSKIYNSYL
ncbi:MULTISPECIES: glycosyltransferase family 4 protein [Bacillus]|uniref:glycosyltransferase family 4 protein n=1 Tax=Bacillus TaxID=1386 RepID=UPI001E5E6AE8|nr:MULTISPECIES: glycosyltransferase family 4 protein [Bacillus cereus group]MCC2412740.1 glycosyltransferase family 4 protein [Bacillus paranthracis]MDA1896222.1 glycosyltransferase family 4 protein [Bacillus cereus group sp. BcHK28]HDR7894653.1 glycosyltransferase family 4 protein [Bacillus pacificus]